MPSLHLPSDLPGLVVYLVGIIILWFVVSIPVYLAGKAVRGREAGFGSALAATLGGVVAYYLVFFIVDYFLGSVVGTSAGPIALIVALVAWLAVFRAAFSTTWLSAVGIAVVAWIILLVLDFLLLAMFGVKFPDFFPW